MNKERLTIEEQLEEIKECGSKFNDAQYYCLYKYDIERIIPYIEDLQQRITRAIDYIRENTELYPFNEDGEGGGLALMDYGVQGLLEILGGKE